MRKAGVSDYEAFARKILTAILDRPVSFEVFADDFASMAEQARRIAAWGPNANVKIPVINTKGQSSSELHPCTVVGRHNPKHDRDLQLRQVRAVIDALHPQTAAIVSIFAGRIADTGIDPIPHLIAARQILAGRPKAQFLWASTRDMPRRAAAISSRCQTNC